jgi:hypothetical protein
MLKNAIIVAMLWFVKTVRYTCMLLGYTWSCVCLTVLILISV